MLEFKNSFARIIPYDEKALRIFESLKKFLFHLVSYEVKVEHIGSTVVSGLGGKGVIDVLIITKRKYMQRIVELLEAEGLRYNPGGGTPLERLFVSGPYKYKGEELHIHITFYRSNEHIDKITF